MATGHIGQDEGRFDTFTLKVGTDETPGKELGPIREVSGAINPASTNAGLAADTTLAATGVGTSDYIVGIIPPATLDAGISFNAWVSAADTITLRTVNNTAGAVDIASATWKFLVAEVA